MTDYSKYTKEELIKEIARIAKTQKYGLVWEEQPEIIRKALKDRFPILTKKSSINCGGQDHLLIRGDNLYVLMALMPKYKGKIDVIYIDPPYFTGNKDFKYNDSFVDREDRYPHSKWLSFMSPRLELAKELLSESGVIFISIDDNEQAQLKLLCDGKFGEENFLSNIIWDHRNSKGNVNHFANIHEYILAYSKNKDMLKKLISPKQNAGEMVKKAKQLFKNNSIEETNNKFRKWIGESSFSGGEKAYNKVDDAGRVYRGVSLGAPTKSSNIYDVKHPNGKNVALPNTGWRNKKETMEELIKNNGIEFGQDETTIPRRIYYLDENMYQSPTSIYSDASNGVSDLPNGIEFEYPKPISLLKYLLSLSNKNATILDFFAGSGTTAQAVLELNKEDGGNRKFILATSNENQICEKITFPRIKKVIEGYKNAKKEDVAGTGGNLHYYKIEFIKYNNKDKANIELNLAGSLMEANGRLLGQIQVQSEAYIEPTRNNKTFALIQEPTKDIVIIKNYNYQVLEQDLLPLLDKNKKTIIYEYAACGEPICYELFEDFADVSIELLIEPLAESFFSALKLVSEE